MRKKTKIGMTLTFSIAFLLLLITPSAYAGSCEENPNPPNSVWVCDVEIIHQGSYPVANDLHFRAHIYESKEWGYQLLGYRVTITCFPNVNCVRTEKPSPFGGWSPGIDVDADGAAVPYCEYCVIVTEFWLNKKNDIRKQDIIWTYGIEEAKALPDHGWRVEDDIITIYNDDSTDNFTISGLEYRVDETLYPDPTGVIFNMSIPGNFTLSPSGVKTFSISLGDIIEGYVYFHYTMLNATGGVLSEQYAAHEIPPAPVGGIVDPVDKFGLLAPYIALASTISVATAATAIYVKRRKKKQ